MRLAVAALIVLALGTSCSPAAQVFDVAAACLTPAPAPSPDDVSLGALVDRADVIVHATVQRTEPTNTPGYYDAQGARRVTLRTVQSSKGAAPSEFVVLDGPCPMLMATTGESLIAFLETGPGGAGLRPIGLPTSALRATPGRTIPQLMAALSAIRPLDADAKALFERNGWTVTAKRDAREFTLPRLSEFGLAARQIRGAEPDVREPFERYVALSSRVGLDPRPYAGRRAALLTFWLEGKPPEYAEGAPFGHVLISERRLIGAWVTLYPEGGTFSLSDRAAALATPYTRRAFPPPNRAPNGIDIAQAYDLASTRAIVFKTGGGGNGEISDPARIRAFVEALSGTLPTTQAVWDASTPPTAYYLHFDSGTGYLSLVYDSRDGLLTVAVDGFAVRPDARFAALVADLR